MILEALTLTLQDLLVGTGIWVGGLALLIVVWLIFATLILRYEARRERKVTALESLEAEPNPLRVIGGNRVTSAERYDGKAI